MALDELRQQPALLESRAPLRPFQSMRQAQRRNLVEGQDHCANRVVPKPLKRRYPLVAIDQHITARLPRPLDYQYRALLAVLAQRGDQQCPSFFIGAAKRLVIELELMNFQLHREPLWPPRPLGLRVSPRMSDKYQNKIMHICLPL